MYNDYYLQQIDNKLSTTNNNLNTVIQNQNIIKENLQTIISGDIIEQQQNQTIINTNGIIALILALLLIYNFVVRCLK